MMCTLYGVRVGCLNAVRDSDENKMPHRNCVVSS